jgi:ribosome biogenesis SPOUT family RNA methylase Rps3
MLNKCKIRGGIPLKIVIEHLEEHLGRWLLLEYENLSKHIGQENIIYSNIKRESWIYKLQGLGEVWRDSILEYPYKERLIILDPTAEKMLKPRDIKEEDMIVVGGILGDAPPKHRTYRYITSRLIDDGVRAFNIGREIYPIDASAIIAYYIYKGKTLEEINCVKRLEVRYSDKSILVLPFSYPVIDGEVVIHPKLLEYLKRYGPFDLTSSIWIEEID